jgi:hypothetical protein
MKVGDKIKLPGLEVEVSFCDSAHKGFLHMTFGDCSAIVSNDDQEIGRVSACIGGGIELYDARATDRPRFFLSYRELWNAFQQALNEAQLIKPEDQKSHPEPYPNRKEPA